jgi:1-acyl-sn-glycerol-3-phosphate acyltransferase
MQKFRPFRWLYSIYAMILFVAIMLIILPFVFLGGFFGRIRGGNFIWHLLRFWADSWFLLIGIFYRKIYEVNHDKKRSYIFVSNHISYLDAAVIPKAFRQPIRPLAKSEMNKVPLFGFIYEKAVVSVNRNSAANRTKSVRILRSLLGKGISVLVFPEGTFNMETRPLKEFYDGAFRIAIETQTPIKPVLFLDNYRRMPYQSVFLMNPGRNRILFLDEIPVSGLTNADATALKEKVFAIMEKKLVDYGYGWRKE